MDFFFFFLQVQQSSLVTCNVAQQTVAKLSRGALKRRIRCLSMCALMELMFPDIRAC